MPQVPAKRIKEEAQDELVHGLYGAILSFSENRRSEYSKEEFKRRHHSMIREARRVLKLFGYDADSFPWATFEGFNYE